MHQPEGMRGIQRRSHRREKRRRPPRRQTALPPDHHPQVTPGDETHGDEQDAVRLAGLVHRNDVRMIHRRDRPRLPQEPPTESLIPR